MCILGRVVEQEHVDQYGLEAGKFFWLPTPENTDASWYLDMLLDLKGHLKM